MRGIWTIAVTATLGLLGCGDSGTGVSTGGASDGTTTEAATDGSATAATEPATTEPTTTEPAPTTGGTTTAPTSTTTPTTEPTTGTPAECQTAADCQAPTCQAPTCEAGMCGTMNLAEGTPVDDLPGDCRETVCDGGGGMKEVPIDDPPAQATGDCKVAGCLQGQVEYTPADDDLPNDDNDCTIDSCMAGEPVFAAKPMHSPCGPMGANFCHSDASCQACKEVTDACEDYGSEPHETQATAFSLGEITDADANGSFACGTVVGAGDVDWYTFSGVDAFLNMVDPSRTLVAENDAGRLCVYLQCDNGTTTVGCGANDTPDMAPLGQKGCCGLGTVSPSLNCTGLDDSAKVWIKVDNPEMLACVPYRLDYHF
ncbi:hypothetical protein [Nannocystis radixulma]|uniref:Myxococcus cysteine-rich repeat-containing protein n=1 Tax=Nannocystis radixulma TaxID=2995305 RepID=A0ABT5BHU0_9BACT|nr:hypothetical protein [Nannocystis radixulma]MDC0673094.1 hypothetical protein [Nannocystis radixulma]